MLLRAARLGIPGVLAAILLSGTYVVGQDESPQIAYIRTPNHQARLDYMARASIWHDPGNRTPEDILNGPPGRFPFDYADATSAEGIPCEYVQPGRELGGKTQKFVCRGPNGQSARVKYFEPPHGNREIFGSVASTRLLWALGFDGDAVYPVRVNCVDCPKNPWTGKGEKGSRVYTSVIEAHYEGTLILSGHNPEEGWTWAQLDHAILNLPQGEFRERQLTHFEALTLLGALIQHGDRKSSQQRLVCRGKISFEAGEVHPASSYDGSGWTLPALFEHRGESACEEPVVTIQDAGATFGAAGAFTDRVTSKMSLKHWASKKIFRDGPDSTECVGDLSISLHSGAPGEPHPRISEQGRQFLLEQLKRLDDAHLKALFTVAQVEVLGDENRYEDPETGTVYTGVDAWVVVFKKKVKEIEEKRCEMF